MISKGLRLVAAALGLASVVTTVSAVPALQLGIAGGTYVAGTDETVYSNSTSFDLYAFLDTKNRSATALLADEYYISAALTPQTAQVMPAPTLGSIVFNGTTVNVTSGMTWGTPPTDTYVGTGDGGLGPHGVYPTYYYQTSALSFGSASRTNSFDLQGTNGSTPLGSSGPSIVTNGDMYFLKFTVNVSGLQAGYGIHFDLFNTKVLDCKKNQTGCAPGSNLDADSFAPFSHDAASCTVGSNGQCEGGGGGGGGGNTPEPASLALVALALFGARAVARRRA